jgi:hypothetical protein
VDLRVVVDRVGVPGLSDHRPAIRRGRCDEFGVAVADVGRLDAQARLEAVEIRLQLARRRGTRSDYDRRRRQAAPADD